MGDNPHEKALDKKRAFIDLDHLASKKPSKNQAIRERDIALARCSALMTCLDGLVSGYEAAREQLPPAGFDLFRAFLEAEIRASKLALTATMSIDLRARAERLTDAGWKQPDPTNPGTRPIWEAVIDDLTPHATSPAATYLLGDMATHARIVALKDGGVPLQANDGRDTLWDLYRVQLEAVGQSWKCIEEAPEDHTLRSVYHHAVQTALATRRRIIIAHMTAQAQATDPKDLLAKILDGRDATDMPADGAKYRCASGCGVVDSVDGKCPVCGDVAVIEE